ncbi:MAG: IS66 family transposase [Elainellaceae cyanobacterium]
MSDEIEIAGIQVPRADWEATPASIQMLVRVLSERLMVLEEKVNQSSQNSSKPPSTDGFGKGIKAKGKGKKPPREGSGKSAPREARKLYPAEDCRFVHEVIPPACEACGASLSGQDSHPHRHQVIELPPVKPEVVEYRLHGLRCECCDTVTRAPLPSGVSALGYGERLTAMVALLSGAYRLSYRQVCAVMDDLFGVRLSRGGVGRLRQEVSDAVSAAVEDAKAYVQDQPVLHSDETSYPVGNRDGGNPQRTKGWLWVLVTPLVSFFEVVLSRSQATAQALIGQEFSGIVTSDRYSAYRWIEVNRWQVCWAHLKRDFTAMAERSGVSQEIGEALLRRQRRLFRWWHRVRDGTLSRHDFIKQVERLRDGFKAELEAATALPIGIAEKTPLAKTIRTCQQLLQVEPALWTFVQTPGVEPTNNAAERALRPAVIWRRTSFGSQSNGGSRFVSRMLTVVTSLKAQHRDVLAFLSQTCAATWLNLPTPSLLPQSESEQHDALATHHQPISSA